MAAQLLLKEAQLLLKAAQLLLKEGSTRTPGTSGLASPSARCCSCEASGRPPVFSERRDSTHHCEKVGTFHTEEGRCAAAVVLPRLHLVGLSSRGAEGLHRLPRDGENDFDEGAEFLSSVGCKHVS